MNGSLPEYEEPLGIGELDEFLRGCRPEVPHVKEWWALTQDPQLSYAQQCEHADAIRILTKTEK